MEPLLQSVILANSSTSALLKEKKKSYLMLPIKFQTTKPVVRPFIGYLFLTGVAGTQLLM